MRGQALFFAVGAAYTAPTPAPVTNLIQLDQLSELLNQASVPPGTYTGALLTLASPIHFG